MQVYYIVHMKTQSSDTMTIRLSGETKSRLDELAQHTRRTRSFLAGEAITDYVERELAIIAGIHQGMADMEAGRVTPHKQAMQQIRKTIARAKKSQ
jgi:predicted transcriptional regulator